MTSRAWVIRGGARWQVDAVESPLPELGPEQIVLAVEGAVVSPVDLAVALERGADDIDPIPGHAAVGKVIATGDKARDLLDRRVVVGPHAPCGECDVCRRGGAVVCPNGAELGVTARGTLGERAVAAARWALPLEGELAVPGVAAALVGGEAALGYALYARAGVGPREPTVVLGDNVVARCLVEILVAKGAPPVVVVRSSSPPAWSAFVESRGAAAVAVDADAPDAEAHAAALAALRNRGHGQRPWKVFETTGEAERQTRAIAIAGPCATVVLAAPGATGHPTRPVDLGDALDRDVAVLGVAGAHPDLLVDVAALAVRGELDLAGAADVVAPGDLAAALTRRHTSRPQTGLVVAVA